jgi:hypothetical protein
MNQDGKEEDTLVLCASYLEPQIKVGIGERRGGGRRGGRRRKKWLAKRACLVPKIFQKFSDSPSHQFLDTCMKY